MAVDSLYDALVLDADDANSAIETDAIDTEGIDVLTFEVRIRFPGLGLHTVALIGSNFDRPSAQYVPPASKREPAAGTLFTVDSSGVLARGSSASDSWVFITYTGLPRYVWFAWDPGAALSAGGYCKVAVFGNRKAG